MKQKHKFFFALWLAVSVAPYDCLAAAPAEPSSLSKLSSAEKTYYSQIFAYTMDNIEAGRRFEWKTHSGSGNIHVEKTFISKSGVPCRNYAETFQVQDVRGAYQGVACKRQGKEGWCRLKPSNAHTCAMEDPGYMFSMPSIGLPAGGGGAQKQAGGGVNINPPSAPNMSGPNVDVEAPKMPESDNPAKDYSDSLTGGAGRAAGDAASAGIGWFSSTFGR